MVKQILGVMVLVAVAGIFAGTAFLSDCRAEDHIIRVKIETSKGDIVVDLDGQRAPITVANFLEYVKDEFYDKTIFHRVVKNFVIQGGGFDENMNRKSTRDPIQNEAGNGLSNKAYTIAMARTQHPDSATSQFYINLKDNLALDRSANNPGYAVFGKVVEGKEVVDAIGRVDTSQEVPLETVLIRQVSKISGDLPDDKESSNDNGDSSGFFIQIGLAGN